MAKGYGGVDRDTIRGSGRVIIGFGIAMLLAMNCRECYDVCDGV